MLRHVLDGGFTLLLLAFALVTGYGLLAPSTLASLLVPLDPPAPVAAVAPPSEAPAPEPPAAEVETAAVEPVPRVPATPDGPPMWDVPPPAVSAPTATPAVEWHRPEPRARPRAPRPVALTPPPAPPRLAVPAPAVPAPPRAAPPAPAPGPRAWPDATVSGRVLDAQRVPLAGASVVLRGVREVLTGPDGAFRIEGVPREAPLLVKLPGYERLVVEPSHGVVEVTLEPQVVRAAFLSYYGVGDRTIRQRVLDLAARTELNAVVIDVKGDRGFVVYPTRVEAALAAGALGPSTVRDFDALMADLKARGIYTIARIVTFKDNVLATARPDLAIRDARTGRPWTDREKLAWLDPFREEAWDYNLALALEAAARGFDEIQFDYVRFPSDGEVGEVTYLRPATRETRVPAIAGFLERARRELGRAGVFVAADLFGYTAFNETDTKIGQRIEALAPHLDFLSPMVYPSGYHRGIPGTPNPVAHPYRIVHESVRLTRKRAAGHPAVVRPWLQDFRDYAFDRRPFGPAEIRAQIKAAADAGAVGWMLWNSRNEYTGAALRGKGSLAER
jgi:hypothetical protein